MLYLLCMSIVLLCIVLMLCCLLLSLCVVVSLCCCVSLCVLCCCLVPLFVCMACCVLYVSVCARITHAFVCTTTCYRINKPLSALTLPSRTFPYSFYCSTIGASYCTVCMLCMYVPLLSLATGYCMLYYASIHKDTHIH